MTNKSAAQQLIDQYKSKKSGQGSKSGNRSGKDNINWFSIPNEAETEVILRFLPAIPGQDLPGKIVKTHFGLPDVEGKTWNIDSLVDYIGDKDPVERVLNKYRDLLNTEDYEFAEKVCFNVLVKSVKIKGKVVEKDKNGVPYDPSVVRVMTSYGQHNYFWVLERIVDPEMGDVTDPKTGYWFKFKREQKDKKLSRDVIPYHAKDFKAEFGTAIADSEEGIEKLLGEMVDFNKIWTKPSDEYVKKARDVAHKLDLYLEKRLAELDAHAEANDSTPVEKDRAAEMAPKGEEAETAEKLTPKKAKKIDEEEPVAAKPTPKKSAPAGAPECFGDKDSLYAGFNSEEEAEDADLDKAQTVQLKKCRLCPHEVTCAEKVGR